MQKTLHFLAYASQIKELVTEVEMIEMIGVRRDQKVIPPHHVHVYVRESERLVMNK